MPNSREKVSSGCAISAILDRTKQRFSADDIVNSISSLKKRSNGKGGGFAAYGIYPERKNEFALHVFYQTKEARNKTEEYLEDRINVHSREEITTRHCLADPPRVWRYFVDTPRALARESNPTREYQQNSDCRQDKTADKEYIREAVFEINKHISGATIVSCGQNMGVFKGVGYPQEVAEFFRLDEYNAYLWTAHGRFPTNSPGWWGGAHPFSLLDWTVVHNGELSSYGTNRRFVDMFGYSCSLQTDTEVITYLLDLLLRKQDLSAKTTAAIFAPPFWEELENMPETKADFYRRLRQIYGGALLNGPFSFIAGSSRGFMVLNDRIKLRPLTVAEKDSRVYASSEEAGVRTVCAEPEEIFWPGGGEPVLALVEEAEEL